MARILVLMGAQGAGKGTQAQKLSRALALPIVATGDILREVAKTDTPIGRKVGSLQAAGQLVPDDILAEIVSNRTQRDDCHNGYILDGFPRTLPQARLLETIAARQGHQIVVINIEVARELLFKRLTGRRTCKNCGRIYNIYFKPTAIEGVCDVCGGELFVREDDNPESIAQRLSLYDEMTSPLLAHFSEAGVLHTVDGTGLPNEVFEKILGAIGGEASARG